MQAQVQLVTALANLHPGNKKERNIMMLKFTKLVWTTHRHSLRGDDWQCFLPLMLEKALRKAFSHYPGPYGLENCAEEDTMGK